MKDRTSASALFVSLSAVGMAAGPLLSLPLSRMPTLRFAGLTFDHVRLGDPSRWHELDVMQLPGWQGRAA